jgi:beta-galactosidase
VETGQEVVGWYRSLYGANVGVDFLFADSSDLAKYKVIVVPPLYMASDALLKRLADYVHGGGLVMAFKSGFCNEFSTVPWEMTPGPLREGAGFHYQEFSSLREPLALEDDQLHAGNENKCPNGRR